MTISTDSKEAVFPIRAKPALGSLPSLVCKKIPIILMMPETQRSMKVKEAGDKDQWLGLLAVFLENPGSMPSTHMVAHNHALFLVQRDTMPFSSHHRHAHT